MSYAPYRSDLNLNERSNPAKQSPSTRVKDFKALNRTPRKRAKASLRSDNYPIIVHCHLCWDWVWQRPQQFLSRLSQRHPILFVETLGPDPELVTPLVRILPTPNYPNITRVRLQFPAWRWGQSDYVDRTRR